MGGPVSQLEASLTGCLSWICLAGLPNQPNFLYFHLIAGAFFVKGLPFEHETKPLRCRLRVSGQCEWLLSMMDETTFSNGCLGSHNDEERSEMRYVMRIARSRESLKL